MNSNNLNVTEEKKILTADIKVFTSDLSVVAGRSHNIKVLEDNEYKNVQISTHINAMVKGIDKFNNQVVFIGAQNGSVYILHDLKTHFIYKHTNNVCSLFYIDGILLSGGWDHALYLYNVKTNVYINIMTHPSSVWSISCTKDGDILNIVTGCADNNIRKIKYNIVKNNLEHIHCVKYHKHPIRSVLVDDKYIISADNDGKIFKIDKNTNELINMRDISGLVFTTTKYGDKIVTAGEDGKITILNDNLMLEKELCIGKPCIWKLCQNGNNLYAGASNGSIYTISEGEAIEIEENKEEKAETTKSNKQIKNQVFTNNNINYKIVDGEVFEEDKNGEWILIGQADKKYDNTFNIEFEGKNYTLHFNNDENVYEIATKFCTDNKVDMSHVDEISKFIEDNFKNKDYEVFDQINIDGIKKVLSNNKGDIKSAIERVKNKQKIIDIPPQEIDELINMLNKINMDESIDLNQFETLLFKFKEYKRFVFYDICKYLVYKKISIDLSFVINDDVKKMSDKEASAFCMLITNMIPNLPFNLNFVDAQIKILRDLGKLDVQDTEEYEHNKKISNKTK